MYLCTADCGRMYVNAHFEELASRGSTPCTNCGGTGKILSESKCGTCTGSGQLKHVTCKGSGRTTCNACSGLGSSACIGCNGDGSVSKRNNCSLHGLWSSHYYCSSHGSNVSQYH